ncbi:MAG: hypothetical protein H0X57_09430 [Rubrobacter sp.]|nr:hypothetical protein [Rubrobacter sp.]
MDRPEIALHRCDDPEHRYLAAYAKEKDARMVADGRRLPSGGGPGPSRVRR